MVRLKDSIRTPLLKILFWQLIIMMGFALVIGLIQGTYKGKSVGAGGLTYWIPTCIFMWRVSAYAGARAAIRFMAAFFAGEFIKLFLCGALFVIAVNYFAIDTLYGLIGVVSGIVAFWVASATLLVYGGKA